MQKYIPILIVFVAMLAAYLLGLQDYVNLETLKAHRVLLKNFVADHFAAASILFLLSYIAATSASLPLDAIFCITAGFLFPQPLSTLYIYLGVLIGSCILFFAAKTAFGELLKKKAGPRLQKIERNFQTHAIGYLIFLRLIPIFPTWIVTFAAAIFNIPFRTFLWTSAIGFPPAAYVFTEAGTGLGALLDSPEPPTLSLLFNQNFTIGMSILTAVATLILIFQWLRNRKKSGT